MDFNFAHDIYILFLTIMPVQNCEYLCSDNLCSIWILGFQILFAWIFWNTKDF